MAINISDAIEKFLDNASVGKAVTDVGAGFALAFSCVLAVGLITGVSVIPADQIRTLTMELDRQNVVLRQQKFDLRNALAESAKVIGTADSAPDDPDALYRLGQRRIALLAAYITAADERITRLSAQPNVPRSVYETDVAEKAKYAGVHDQLVSQKEIVDEQQQRVTTLENRLTDSRSLTANLETFTNNISAVLVFSVILGVVLSQVNRLLIISAVYDRLLSDGTNTFERKSAVARSVNKDEYEYLVSNYYRYVEGSINMFWPVIAFGVVVPRFINAKLVSVSAAWHWISFLGCVVIASLLSVSGFFTYKVFREREKQLAAQSAVKKPGQ